jgi:hypothetical protein
MDSYRRQLGDSTWLIAKLERESAIGEAQRIGRVADELWICRGDLGAEMGVAAMAERLFRFSPEATGRPVLLAGQVLEFMTDHPFGDQSPVRGATAGLPGSRALRRDRRGLLSHRILPRRGSVPLDPPGSGRGAKCRAGGLEVIPAAPRRCSRRRSPRSRPVSGRFPAWCRETPPSPL